MTQRDKLLAKARNNPVGIHFRELCSLAERFGFVKRDTKGSQVVYEREGIEEILTFQNAKGMAKAYQVKQFLSVVEKYRLGDEK
jgi:hypothetical protein